MSEVERKFWEQYKKEASDEDTKRFDELFIVYSDLVDQSKEILVQLYKALCGIPLGVAIRYWLIHTSHIEEHVSNFSMLIETKIFPIHNEEGRLLTLGQFKENSMLRHQQILAAIKLLKKKSKAEKESIRDTYLLFASFLSKSTLGLIEEAGV
ncbi:MAG: hypothetical protein H0V82_05070 [Candidatus Protochlamydia sp.]|nr:hypothetical protein [Candidatus Protochlamydia sp.]